MQGGSPEPVSNHRESASQGIGGVPLERHCQHEHVTGGQNAGVEEFTRAEGETHRNKVRCEVSIQAGMD